MAQKIVNNFILKQKLALCIVHSFEEMIYHCFFEIPCRTRKLWEKNLRNEERRAKGEKCTLSICLTV